MNQEKINVRPFVLTIDGADKTGKDSVRDHLIKKTNGNLLIIVRSFISQIVYSKIYNRVIDSVFFISALANSISANQHFVLLICSDEEEIKKRFVENDEKDIYVKDFFNQQEQFINFVNRFNENIKRKNEKDILIIDTHNKSIDEVCEQILSYYELEI